eukprot:2849488-Prymnesium_polylepis.2
MCTWGWRTRGGVREGCGEWGEWGERTWVALLPPTSCSTSRCCLSAEACARCQGRAGQGQKVDSGKAGGARRGSEAAAAGQSKQRQPARRASGGGGGKRGGWSRAEAGERASGSGGSGGGPVGAGLAQRAHHTRTCPPLSASTLIASTAAAALGSPVASSVGATTLSAQGGCEHRSIGCARQTRVRCGDGAVRSGMRAPVARATHTLECQGV